MTGNEIRRRFLQYFADQGHTIVDSSSLVPHDDPTLLFTNAGMVQFKRVFMGEEQRDYVRAATVQRCVRAGGKHNDLRNVGHTARHHTFFEMLGNFSFGDYFKKEAIDFAWDFLTKELGLDPARLWVSVFRDDDEAYELWSKIEDLPAGRIVRLGEPENFWAMGDTGPCGPCSEIHIDQGPEAGCGRPDCAVGCDCDRFLELWNLVFMQSSRDADGKLTPLPRPSIDTGMGLERITAVMQGRLNNFDSDLFSPIIDRIAALAGKTYGADRGTDVAMRVIADHARATTFLVADGVLPANEGRGYVLRRIMRRAIRFGRSLGLTGGFFAAICAKVTELMAGSYPHLESAAELLAKVVTNEETRFGETLDHGLVMLSEEIERLAAGQDRVVIDGEFIFKLYDTYGFPVDIVRDVALERGAAIDEAGFHAAMEVQRQQSKRSWKGCDVEHLAPGVIELLKQGRESRFVGYEQKSADSVIGALVGEAGRLLDGAEAGEVVRIYCPETPFYAECGGQVGDTGEIICPQGRITVTTARKVAEGLILHEGRVTEGSVAPGDQAALLVTSERRTDIALNHTATHLLQAAMRELLGDHIKQAGSLVDEERLRFDFTHFSPLTGDEIRTIEQLVNEQIRCNTPVATDLLGRDQAIAEGATALFGEKYGDEVRVVSIGDFSKELCGGIHAAATGMIGFFKIISETGIAAGVRRVEAVTGSRAVAWVQELARQADEVSAVFSAPLAMAPDKIRALLKQQKKLEKEVAALTARLALVDLDRLLAGVNDITDDISDTIKNNVDQLLAGVPNTIDDISDTIKNNIDRLLDGVSDTTKNVEALAGVVEVNGVRVLAMELPLDSPGTLRDIGDKVRERLGSGVAVLGGTFKGKAALLALVSKDLTGRIKAGDLVRATAKIVGGRGGGRPDMAQAGGPMTDKLAEAIASVPGIVRSLLES